MPELAQNSAKIRRLHEQPGEFDTLYFGSSRIYHQILPTVFDKVTAAAGQPTHSLNMAVDGMKPLELNFFVENVLRKPLPGLKNVLLEQSAITMQVAPDRVGTARFDYWHDWPRMAALARLAWLGRKAPKHFGWNSVRSLGEPWHDLQPHVLPFFHAFTNLGRVSEYRRFLSEEAPRFDAYYLGQDRDGYAVTGRPETMPPAEWARYEEKLGERRGKKEQVSLADPVSQDTFEKLVRFIELKGPRVVLVNAPTLSPRSFQLTTRARSGRLVLDYTKLSRYEPLYAPENRVDADHLNHEGAKIFSRILAEEFCRGGQGK